MTKSNLVIQTAFLGDLILSIPTLKRIKVLFPAEKLIILCKQGLGEFLLTEKIVDEIIEVEKSNSQSYNQALTKIQQYEINHLFCIHRSPRSLFFSSKIKANKKIGFSSFLGFWIFDDLVPFVQDYPEVIRQFSILETVDKKSYEVLNDIDFSYLNDSALPEVPEFFSFHHSVTESSSKNRIAVFPGSVWATKKWTNEGFLELCRLLINNNYKVDLLGGPSERQLCETIAEQVPGTQVLAGQFSIAESIQKIKNYDLVVSNDSAPTHMSAYNNIPVVTIFGPTVPAQGFRPWSNNAAIVENKSLKCRPCGRHGHHQCPLGHHNCMKSIKAEQVFAEIQKLLS